MKLFYKIINIKANFCLLESKHRNPIAILPVNEILPKSLLSVLINNYIAYLLMIWFKKCTVWGFNIIQMKILTTAWLFT